MNRQEMTMGLGMFEAFWPGKFEVDPVKVRAWMMACGDLDASTFQAAILFHAKTEEWPPTVSHIRAFVRLEILGTRMSAGEAWEQVLKTIRRTPFGDAIECSDPVANRTASLIGWTAIESGENRGVISAQFRKLYDDLAGAEVREQISKHEGGPRLGGQTAKQIGEGMRKELGDGQD